MRLAMAVPLLTPQSEASLFERQRVRINDIARTSLVPSQSQVSNKINR